MDFNLQFAMTMTIRSLVLFVLGFSGLFAMQGCGSTYTITFLYMAAPSVASDPQRLVALISARAQPSAGGASGSALKRTLSAKGGPPTPAPPTPYPTPDPSAGL